MAIRSEKRKIEEEIRLLRTSIRQFCTDQTGSLTIQWIPGHEDIEGNEHVDQLAKDACTKGLFWEHHPSALSTIRKFIFDKTKQEWEQRFLQSRSQSYVSTYPPSPSELRDIYEGLPMGISSVIAEFRSGHTRLLPRQHRDQPPQCHCGNDTETQDHFLLHCHLYDDLRRELEIAVSQDRQLDQQGQGNDSLSAKVLLDNPRIIRKTASFILSALDRRKAILSSKHRS